MPKTKIDALKRKAKRLKKGTPGMTHAKALELTAQAHGYLDWRHARAELKPDEEGESVCTIPQ